MNWRAFVLNGESCRVVSRTVRELEYGYTEATDERYNVLQARRKVFFGLFSRWVDVEKEHVPSFAWISNACLGSSDWESPMLARIQKEAAKCD